MESITGSSPCSLATYHPHQPEARSSWKWAKMLPPPHLTLPKKEACLLDDRKPPNITACLDKCINIARNRPSAENHPLFIAGISNSRQSVTGNKIRGGFTRLRAGYLLKTPLAISGRSMARRGSGSTALAGRRPSIIRQG